MAKLLNRKIIMPIKVWIHYLIIFSSLVLAYHLLGIHLHEKMIHLIIGLVVLIISDVISEKILGIKK